MLHYVAYHLFGVGRGESRIIMLCLGSPITLKVSKSCNLCAQIVGIFIISTLREMFKGRYKVNIMWCTSSELLEPQLSTVCQVVLIINQIN